MNFLKISILFLILFSISCNKNKTEDTKKIETKNTSATKKKITKKTNFNNENPLKIELKYSKKVRNGTLIPVDINIKNIGEFPIIILSASIQVPKTSTNFSGTRALKAFKHKFKKGKSFSRSFLEKGKIDPKKYHYTIPAVHQIKEVLYSEKTKNIKLKLIPQDITTSEWQSDVSINYIVVNNYWNNRIFNFKGKNIEDGVIRELYTVSGKINKKLENSLLPSSDLGQAKNIKVKMKISLTGWTPKLKANEIAEYAYIKATDSWIYNDPQKTTIENKKGETIILPNINSSRTILKANMKKELSIYLYEKYYEDVKDVLKEYIKGRFEKEKDFYHVVIPSEKVLDVILKLKKVDYGIHKGKSIKSLKKL